MSGYRNSRNKTPKGWGVLIGLVVLSLLLTACGGAQKPKTYTVGVIMEIPWQTVILDPFKAEMATLGYVEGKNITYIFHSEVGPDMPAFEREAKSFRDQKVDLIFALGTLTTKAAKKTVEGTNIPVLFVPVIDPVGEGIVASVSHPGGNVTGVQIIDQSSKALEWLLKSVPGTKKVYAPYNPADDVSAPLIKSLREAAPKLGVELLPGEVSSVDQMLAAIQALPTKETVIFFTVPLPSLEDGIEAAGKLATERGIPIGSCNRDAGLAPFPILNYTVSNQEEAKQGASMADQIFKGTKPANLPVQTAEYYLEIDLKTAQAIGLNIPENILRQADKVIR